MFNSSEAESPPTHLKWSTAVAAICFAVACGFGATELFAQKPYDASTQDIFYRYDGSAPEIVGVPNGDGSVDVAWHDHSQGDSRNIYIDRLPPNGGQAQRLASISTTSTAGAPRSYGRLGGYVKDELGNHYVLTCQSEKITPSDKGYVWRPNILGLIKLDNGGRLVWQKDLNASDSPRYLQQPVYGPMRAGTARLAYGQVKSQTNLALGKNATLSSVYVNNGTQLMAGNAVDGNAPQNDVNRLAHTNEEDHPYLTIDLGSTQSISEFVVQGRDSNELNGYELRVTDSVPALATLAERQAFLTANSLFRHTGPNTFSAQKRDDRVQINNPISGRYVTIMMPRKSRLVLYELQVLAPVVDEPLLYVHYMTSDGQWDANINLPNGDRHQHSNWCLVNATTGLPPMRKGFGRCSEGHSFDVRTVFDSQSRHFVALEVSDVSFAATLDQPLRHAQDNHYADGVSAIAHTRSFAHGNDHYIELGGLAMVGNPNGGSDYMALLTRRGKKDSGPYLWVSKTNPNFWVDNNSVPKGQTPSRDPNLPWATERNVSNPNTWLSATHDVKTGACRPKLVSVGGDRFIVLYEFWRDGKFDKTLQIHIDGSLKVTKREPNNEGSPVQGGQAPSPRLHRGDDAFALGGKAAWVTGAGEGSSATLTLHQVAADGTYSAISYKLP